LGRLADIFTLSSLSPPVRIPWEVAEQCLERPGESTLPILNNKGETPSQPGEYRIHKVEITQRGIGQPVNQLHNKR